MASETASVVRAAVQLLPDGQRRVVELAYFEGLTCREVAKRDGHPRGHREVAAQAGDGQAGNRAGPAAAGVDMSTADRDPAAFPIGLRERVMAASLLARAVGQPVPAVPAISADEAFARAADAFYGTARRPQRRGLEDRGTARARRAGAGRAPDRGRARHAPLPWPVIRPWPTRSTSNRPRIRPSARPAAPRPRPGRNGAARPTAPWSSRARPAVTWPLAAVPRSHRRPSRPVAVHGIRLPLGDLLVVRAFELWVHDNDIRRAAACRRRSPTRRRCA